MPNKTTSKPGNNIAHKKFPGAQRAAALLPGSDFEIDLPLTHANLATSTLCPRFSSHPSPSCHTIALPPRNPPTHPQQTLHRFLVTSHSAGCEGVRTSLHFSTGTWALGSSLSTTTLAGSLHGTPEVQGLRAPQTPGAWPGLFRQADALKCHHIWAATRMVLERFSGMAFAPGQSRRV